MSTAILTIEVCEFPEYDEPYKTYISADRY